ncbi:MAG: pilus assembly protein N-terminal domain-containing protein [Candidatus Melainabacteria bacterium]|nr:pilus assembly protein N-terminal domain-containing protein [Candidatus Melainabacteria bacterium]
MNKPRKSLAFSLSLIVTQAGWLTAQPAGAADAIWQKMSSTPKSQENQASKGKKSVKKTVRQARVEPKRIEPKRIAPIVDEDIPTLALKDNHVMIFMGKGKADMPAPAPAAALSIHPALAETAKAPADKPSLVAYNGAVPSITATAESASEGKQLLAQLAPDQLIAQSTSSDVTATPIPPVVTGTVDLEEFKTVNVIDLKVSQSRTFKLRNKIVRTSISDPGIAEPVVVAENQIVMLGKAPGSCTMLLWDDAGNTAAIDIVVERDYSELQTALREIDPRIIVKAFSVGGSDRVLLLGDVDHAESVIRAFLAANVFMDDRGMNIQVANNRLINARIGEQGAQGGGTQGGGGRTGQLAQLSSVDKYTFFPNTNNNISKGQVITSDGGRVTSLVKVRKTPLIVLHVTFMEMNTTSARELATAVGVAGTTAGFAYGVGGTNNPASFQPISFPGYTQRIGTATTAITGIQSGAGVVAGARPNAFSTGSNGFVSSNLINGGTISGIGLPQLLTAVNNLGGNSILFGAPGGTAFQTGGLMNLISGVSNFPSDNSTRQSFSPTIQGIISNSRNRILAEPSLVCISGERASFLAGGEIPILQAVAAAGAAQQSVVFEPFGLRINFIPVLTDAGTLNLEISPEERIPSLALGFQLPGTNSVIPGFTTRKMQTIVEMKPGQELFVGGLITTNNGREMNKLPIIGEMPVLGAIYRSKAFAKNESELVIAIRPEIILPGTPGQLKLPEEIGRVEGPRDTNMFQVEPSVIDERHYTTGRSERHQKTSPTLPEGAPIPDS